MKESIKMSIRAIFFDLGWTLEIPETGDWMLTTCFRKYYPKEVTDRIDRDLWHTAMHKAAQPLIDHHRMDTLETEIEDFAQFYEILMSSLPGVSITREIALEISRDRCYNQNNVIVLPGTVSTLQTLKDRGYLLGVISDNWPSTRYRLEQTGIAQYFDQMTISSDLGVYKPDERLFLHALKEMGVSAQESAFVDDLAGNLETAERLGMYPVLSLVKPNTKEDPRYTMIHAPEELLELEIFKK